MKRLLLLTTLATLAATTPAAEQDQYGPPFALTPLVRITTTTPDTAVWLERNLRRVLYVKVYGPYRIEWTYRDRHKYLGLHVIKPKLMTPTCKQIQIGHGLRFQVARGTGFRVKRGERMIVSTRNLPGCLIR